MRHVMSHSGITPYEHWAAKEAVRWEKDVAKLPTALSELESSAVGLGSSNKHFKCLLCTPPKQLTKRFAFEHLTKLHPRDISEAEAANFVVVKDGIKLSRGWQWTHLETYFQNAAEQDDAFGNAADSPAAAVPEPQDKSSLQPECASSPLVAAPLAAGSASQADEARSIPGAAAVHPESNASGARSKATGPAPSQKRREHDLIHVPPLGEGRGGARPAEDSGTIAVAAATSSRSPAASSESSVPSFASAAKNKAAGAAPSQNQREQDIINVTVVGKGTDKETGNQARLTLPVQRLLDGWCAEFGERRSDWSFKVDGATDELDPQRRQSSFRAAVETKKLKIIAVGKAAEPKPKGGAVPARCADKSAETDEAAISEEWNRARAAKKRVQQNAMTPPPTSRRRGEQRAAANPIQNLRDAAADVVPECAVQLAQDTTLGKKRLTLARGDNMKATTPEDRKKKVATMANGIKAMSTFASPSSNTPDTLGTDEKTSRVAVAEVPSSDILVWRASPPPLWQDTVMTLRKAKNAPESAEGLKKVMSIFSTAEQNVLLNHFVRLCPSFLGTAPKSEVLGILASNINIYSETNHPSSEVLAFLKIVIESHAICVRKNAEKRGKDVAKRG